VWYNRGMNFPNLQAKLAQAPALYATDGQKDKKVVVTIMLKNFWEYEVFEAEKQGEDILMFCQVYGIETELGYVSFKEIEPHILRWSGPSAHFTHAY
jgi:hypothetical protein